MSRIDDQRPLVDLGQERPQLPARARNLSPIVPRASISGRALVAVVAIMTFLASITTGTVLLVSASAAEWQSEVASEITIQVRPAAGRDLNRDTAAVAEAMRAQPGIVEIRPFTREESAKLLEPWLGSGLSLDDLPVPRVIVARVQPGTALDLAALRSRVTQVAPTASVDDHRAWIERMRSMTGATVFAGVGMAMLAFGFSESIAGWFSGTPVGDQFAALLGTFSLRPSGYLALAAQAVLIAAITAWASRRTLFATLDDID